MESKTHYSVSDEEVGGRVGKETRKQWYVMVARQVGEVVRGMISSWWFYCDILFTLVMAEENMLSWTISCTTGVCLLGGVRDGIRIQKNG